jgi:ABC-type antimicrobial peptide transport system permease subunit
LAHGYVNDSWLSNNTMTFAMLKPGTDANSLSAKIRNLTRLHTGRSDVWTHFLHPLSKWRLYSAFKDGKVDGGRIATVRMFALIGLFILLIACVNFMNLSTARSEERSREVGVRKVAGAGRSSLVFQFLAEAFLITLFAGIAGMGIVQLALPGFNKLTDAGLAVPFGNISFWLCFVGFLLLTSALAGSYPALYLSSFRPAGIFKQAFRKTGSWFSPRKALVVFQFSIAIALIICTFVVRNQVQFAQTRDLGYENRGLLQVDFTGEIGKNYALISQELIASGNAISVTKTMSGITEGGSRSWGFRWANENPADTNIALTLYSADGNLVKTTGMQLVSGRDIDIDHYGSDSTAVLLNETAVRLMGFQDPIGQVLQQPHSGKSWQVVGVVKDYVQGSPYDLVPPTIIVGPAGWFNTMQIRLTPGRPVSTILSEMQKIFRKYNPSFPFEYAFSDDQFSRQFSDEQRTKTITGVFAALAIFISCLGLMGLSAYIAESRRKEIGVRKVLGASSMSITGLLSFDFLKLVMLALVIASPLAWYTMSRWLEDFAYRVHIGATTFIFAGGIAMAVTVIMIAVQTARAALANPVRSLRSQ